MEVFCQLHAPTPFRRGKHPWCSSNRRLFGRWSRLFRFGVQKISHLLGIEPRFIGCSVSCMVVVQSDLSYNNFWIVQTVELSLKLFFVISSSLKCKYSQVSSLNFLNLREVWGFNTVVVSIKVLCKVTPCRLTNSCRRLLFPSSDLRRLRRFNCPKRLETLFWICLFVNKFDSGKGEVNLVLRWLRMYFFCTQPCHSFAW